MKLKSFVRYCPSCRARYNAFLAAEPEFECRECRGVLRWEPLYRARLVFMLCTFFLPSVLYAVEPTRWVLLLGISLGGLLYTNMLSLVPANQALQRTRFSRR